MTRNLERKGRRVVICMAIVAVVALVLMARRLGL